MAKKDADFRDLSPADQARLVANTALVAAESGGPVSVFNGRFKGVQGVMVWMPGYSIENGQMNAIGEGDDVR